MQLETLLQQAEHAIKSTTSIQDLEQCRVEYLGKKGSLTEIIKTIGQLPPDERKLAGQNINLAKENIEQWIKEKSILLKNNQLKQQLEKETIDIKYFGGGRYSINLISEEYKMPLPIHLAHKLVNKLKKEFNIKIIQNN